MDVRWFRLGDRGRYPGEVPINYGIAIIGMSSLTGDLVAAISICVLVVVLAVVGILRRDYLERQRKAESRDAVSSVAETVKNEDSPKVADETTETWMDHSQASRLYLFASVQALAASVLWLFLAMTFFAPTPDYPVGKGRALLIIGAVALSSWAYNSFDQAKNGIERSESDYR